MVNKKKTLDELNKKYGIGGNTKSTPTISNKGNTKTTFGVADETKETRKDSGKKKQNKSSASTIEELNKKYGIGEKTTTKPFAEPKTTPTKKYSDYSSAVKYLQDKGVQGASGIMTENEWRRRNKNGGTYQNYLDSQVNKYGKGNIDLTNRPIYKNPDGTISTVASYTMGIDGKHYVLPSIVRDVNGNAKKLETEDDVFNHFKNTGEYLGVFDTQEEADEYAQNLHIEQEKYYPNEKKTVGEGILDSAGYIGEKVGRGVIDGLEGVTDLAWSLLGATGWGVTSGFGLFENDVSRAINKWYNDINENDITDLFGSAEDRYDAAPEWLKDLGWLPETIGNIVPFMVETYFSGGASAVDDLAVAGKPLWDMGKKFLTNPDVHFGMSAGGDAIERAIEKGANPITATTYGSAIGAVEALSEKLFGTGYAGTSIGASKRVAKEAVEETAGKAFLKKIWNSPVTKNALDIGTEWLEEDISEFADPVLQRVMGVDTNAEWASWSDYVESGSHGAILSIVMKALGVPSRMIAKHGKSKTISTINESAEALNGLIQDDTSKLQPLPNNATEEEIVAKQKEITAVALAYDNAVKKNVQTEQQATAEQPIEEQDTIEKAAMDVVASRNAAQTNARRNASKGTPLAERLEAQSQNNEPIEVADVKKAAGVGDNGAKLITELASNEGVTFSQAERTVKTAYLAGYADVEAAKVNFATDTQINAYTAGKKDRVMDDLTNKENSKNATVYDSGVVKNKNFNKLSTASQEMLSTLAKDHMMSVEVRDSILAAIVKGKRYYADASHQDGVMKGSMSTEKPLIRWALHEDGHRMEQMATDEWNVLANALYERAEGLGRATKLGVSHGLQFDKIKSLHDAAEITKDTSGYFGEVVMRELETIFASPEEFNAWRAELDNNAQVKTAWQKFMDFLYELIEDVKRLIANRKLSKEARAEARAELAELERIKELYAKVYLATKDAVEQRAAEQKSATKAQGENARKNTGIEGRNIESKINFALREDAEAEITKALNGKNYKGEIKLTNSSPSIMLNHKGVRNLPMTMKVSHIRENILTETEAKAKGLKVNKNINYHGLGKERFLEVIAGLDNVTEAYRGTPNAKDSTRREKYFLLVTQHTDETGNIINIPVYINEKGLYNRAFIDTNKIATVFGREKLREYIARQVQEGNLVRIKKRSSKTSESTSPINADYGNETSVAGRSVTADTSTTKDRISQNLKFVKSDFSLKDSEGKTLTKEQQEYFKNSKVRDGNGNLLVVYHGTSKGGFTVFDTYAYYSKFGLFGNGAYFTDNKDIAEQYTRKGKGKSPQVYSAYLNITNPIDMDAKANVEAWNKALQKTGEDFELLKGEITNEQAFKSMVEDLEYAEVYSYDAAEIVRNVFENMGYDGITHIGGGRVNQSDGTKHRVFISFEQEQIKDVTNTKPTSNPDIHFSLKEPIEEIKGVPYSKVTERANAKQSAEANSAKNLDFKINEEYNRNISYALKDDFKTKIKYSPSGIKLPTDEYAKFYSSTSTDYYKSYKTHEGLQYQSCVADNSHILYIYEDGGFGKYNVVARVDYKYDEVAKAVTEVLNNEEHYKVTGVVNDILETLEVRRSGYTVYNTRTKRRSSSRGDGTLLEGTSKSYTGRTDGSGSRVSGDKPGAGESERTGGSLSEGKSFSLMDTEQYTEKEYRKFGWARANNILSEGQNADYRSKFADAKVGRAKFNKSKKGEYIIPVSDIYDSFSEGIDNVLVFAKGTITNPIITSVIEIYEYDETILSDIRRYIYDCERRGIQQETGVSFRRYYAYDFEFSQEQQESVLSSSESSKDNGFKGKIRREDSFADKGVVKTNFSLKEANDISSKDRKELLDIIEHLKGEFEITKFAKADQKKLAKMTRALLKEYTSHAEYDETFKAIDELYNYMANGEDGQPPVWENVYSRAYNIAHEIVENAIVVDDYTYQEYKHLRDYLRKTPMKFDARHDSVPSSYENFNDFRKQNMGRLKFTKDGMSIDVVYQELANLYPEFFDAEEQINSADQLERIVDVLYDIQPTEINPFYRQIEQVSMYLANDLTSRFFDIPQAKPTFADKVERRVIDERARGAKKLEALREQKDAKIKKLIEAQKEKTKKQLDKIREQRDAKVKKEQEKRRAAISKMSENQKAKVLRARIMRHASDFNKKLLNPTDNQHIPQELQGAVATLLECINLESNYTYDVESGSYKKNDDGLPTKRTQAFHNLQKVYADIASSVVVDPDLMGENGLLSGVISLADKRIVDMTSSELETVWQAIRAIEASVSSANKLFSAGKFAVISDVAEALRAYNEGKISKAEFKGILGKGKKLATLDMLTPETYLHYLGDAGDSIFRMMRDAQDKHISIMKEVSDFTHKELKDVNVNKLEKTLHTVKLGGEDVRLSTAQLMELYVLMKREQAREHILIGGILPDVTKAKGLKLVTKTKPVRNISVDEISAAVSNLTDEQKKVADKLQKYVSTVLSAYGNEASMQVYNYEKFLEENYWTIRTNKQEIQSDVDKDTAVTSVANKGMTKATKPHANTSVCIGSIFDTFAAHSSDMATYAAWLGTSEDVNRIRNFVFWENGARTGTVKDIIDTVHGTQGSKYLEKLLTDIAIGVKGADNLNPFDKLIGHYKAASVGANLRVVIQQPTAILRALDMIDAHYLAEGAVRPLKGWEKAKKYAPIAQWKDWGYFDINTGRQMKDVLFDNASLLEKTKQVGMWGASMADSLAWGQLWNAVEAETKAKHKELEVGSEKYYETVAKRFTEIVDHTQVVDGILQRSQIMRSADNLTKMATSFMGEPTKQYNMAISAFNDLKSGKGDARKKAAARLGRTAMALAVSGIINACAQSIIDAMRDDDKEEKYWERWLTAFVGDGEETKWYDTNLADTANPLNYVPFAKDIVSIIRGYDVKRMDTEAITKVFDASKNMYKAATGEGKYTIAEASAQLLAEIARLFGVPVANVKRDVKSLVMATAIETDSYLMQYRIEKAMLDINYAGNSKNFMDILFNAYNNDREAYEFIYNDMLESGYEADKIQSGMETRMKKAEGVEKASDLSKRYMTPDDEKKYDSSLSKVKSSKAWKSANAAQRKEAEADLYDFLTSTSDAMEKTRAEARAFGVDETEYTLWQLAIEMVDQPKGQTGSGNYDYKEKADAINSLSLGDREIAYFFGKGLNETAKEEINETLNAGIDMQEYVNFKAATSEMKADKNAKGNSIPNSKKRKVVNYLNNASLTNEEWEYFYYEIMNYKK